MKPVHILPILCCISLLAISCGKTSLESVGPEDALIAAYEGQIKSIQEFGVLPGNSPAVNRENLQKAIDWAAEAGAALYVTPVENGYPIDGGLILRKNVALIGAHGPTGRGTRNAAGDGPTGSLFVITDTSNPFLTVYSATRVEGIQFYYPDQTWTEASKIIPYPATIQVSQDTNTHGVTLRDLSFYGEYFAMDFRAKGACEQILFENCYGYPLSGQFIAIDRCFDIPRILHCHVNPANMREFSREFKPSVTSAVVAQKTYSYWIDHTDNAVIMDIFAFGVWGGIYLGDNTYGQFTSFNFDCVNRGIYRTGNTAMNRTWMISQGSIIANLGDKVEDIHPIIIAGGGHTSLTNIECFSGGTWVANSPGRSYDFLLVEGYLPSTTVLTACRAWGYVADDPITLTNAQASVWAFGLTDKDGQLSNREVDFYGDLPSGTTTAFDRCESAEGWGTSFPGGVSLDSINHTEGKGCISVSDKEVVFFSKRFPEPLNTNVSYSKGHLCLKLYISDISALNAEEQGSIEISSSGTFDKNEFGWRTTELSLHSGWNSLDLPLRKASVTGGNPDLRAINFIRIYHTGVIRDVTVKLDDIYFYQE